MEERVGRAGRVLRWALATSVLLGSTGCYGYAYQVRAGKNLNALSLDAEAHSDTRWSYAWGLVSDEWSPTKCVQDLDGKCKPPPATCPKPGCDGVCPPPQQIICPNGVGRVETDLRPYSMPLFVLTLGIVMPVRVRAYCSAAAPPPDAAPSSSAPGAVPALTAPAPAGAAPTAPAATATARSGAATAPAPTATARSGAATAPAPTATAPARSGAAPAPDAAP
jgi:hypothetical protein